MNKFSYIELNEKKLADQTLDYILDNQNTSLGSSLYLRILDPRIKYGDLNNHIEFLKERLSHLKFFVDCDTVEFKNDLETYEILEKDDFGRIVDNSWILGPMIFEKEKFSKEIFWQNKIEEENFQSISNFVCFKERIVAQTKLYSALAQADIFNIDGWIQYYQDLLDLKFPEFGRKILDGKKIIKYKSLTDDFYLGIETDYIFCKNGLKKGNWFAPDYKLIIFKIIGKNKINRVVVFEKFVHPHFDPPAYSFEGYFYLENLIVVSEKELSAKYIIQKEFLGDDTVKLYMPHDFGRYLKRHAYFYYDLLYKTTKQFIRFVEESFESKHDE